MPWFFKETKPPALAIHVVLDESGSMASIKDDTIGAFNQYVESVAKENPESALSLTVFNTNRISTIIDNKPIQTVSPLTEDQFQPAAMTPLYDAIGATIEKLNKIDTKYKALVILTDGQENRSREFNKEGIKKLIDAKQERDNWLVIYLGANQDAFEEGSKFGTQSANTMSYDTKNMGQTMGAAASATMRYANSGDRMKAGFTSEERKAAK